MHIEQAHLADDGGADEMRIFIYFGANFQAVAAADALRQGVAHFLRLRRHARAGADVVRAIDGNPAFGALQIFEHGAAIDLQVADQRKFGQRLQANRFFQFVDQRSAGLARLAVDQHGAGAANFFQAVRVVGDRGGFLAVPGERMLGDVAQADDYVHVRAVAEFVLFPMHGFVETLLAFDANDESLFGHWSSLGASAVLAAACDWFRAYGCVTFYISGPAEAGRYRCLNFAHC